MWFGSTSHSSLSAAITKVWQWFYHLDCWQKSEEDALFFLVKSWHLHKYCASTAYVPVLICNMMEENMFWIAYIVLNMVSLGENPVYQWLFCS